MSVWKATCYRDDALQAVACHLLPGDLECQYVHSLADFEISEHGTYDLPGGVVAGNLRKQAESNYTILPAVVSFTQRPDPNRDVFRKLVKTLPESYFGVHGVYHFISDVWHEIFKPTVVVPSEAAFAQNLVNFSYAASYRTAKEAVSQSQTSAASYARYVAHPQEFVRGLVKLGTSCSGWDYKRAVKMAFVLDEDYPEVVRNKPYWLNTYSVYWWKSVLILHRKFDNKCYTFTRTDIDRIDRIVTGLAWSQYYCNEYSVSEKRVNEKMGAAFLSIMRIIRKSFAGIDKSGANLLCRAYDVALWTHVAEQTCDINEDAYNRQRAKIAKEGLGKYLNIDSLIDIARGFKLREGIELLQVYKCLPQPDFDYFGAAFRQETLYDIDRPYGVEVEDEDTGPYEDFWLYYRYTLMRSFHGKHGVCPGRVKAKAGTKGWRAAYPYVKPEIIPFREIDDIDMANTFRYNAHGTDVMDLIKDKAICPTNVRRLENEQDLANTDVSYKNYLMNVLSQPTPIDVQNLIRNHDQVWDDVKAEDKPEAKKENGRWFFEAGTHRRLLQSEYETSVAEYGKSTTGCMMGKSTRDKITTMNYVCAPDRALELVGYRPLKISFDLEKFSPAMKEETHKRRNDIYAELFGQPHLRDAANVYTKGQIHYIKRKVHHSFDKKGRDFEGFSCKSNTVYHCAVMGYCMRRLRELGLVKQAGRFSGFVDDGLLRMEVKVEGFDNRVKRILEVLEKVYKMANLYISWDKTFISSYFSVFLNEFDYGGTPITPGIRSFLKMTNRGESLCPSFVDDQSMLDSTARGAISAGCPTHIVAAAHGYYLMDLFRKWGKGAERFTTSLALAAFAPINLGGFGCSSVMNLSGSVSGPTFVESIGCLRAIAFRFRKLAPLINKFVNQPMRQMSGNAKVLSPLAAIREGRTLKSTRAKIVIERRLMKMMNTPVIQSLIGDVDVRLDEASVAHLIEDARIPVEMTQLIYTSSLANLVSQIAGKFLRTRTAFKIVHPKHFYRATIANMTEARCLISEWHY